MFLIAHGQNSNSFEGIIKYKLKFQDKTGEMSDEDGKMFMGDEQIYYIKENKYRSEMNGMMKMTQIYSGNDTLYSLMGGIDAVLFNLAIENPDSLISYKIEDSKEKIKGLKCKVLKIIADNGTVDYYFNPIIAIASDAYKNHKYGFWKLSLEVTNGALPLKLIADYGDVKIETVAKKITPQALNDNLFIVPNLPRVKNPEE